MLRSFVRKAVTICLRILRNVADCTSESSVRILCVPRTTIQSIFVLQVLPRKSVLPRNVVSSVQIPDKVNRLHCYLILSGAPFEGWGAPRNVLYLRLCTCGCFVSPVKEEVLWNIFVTENVLERCRKRVWCWKRVRDTRHVLETVPVSVFTVPVLRVSTCVLRVLWSYKAVRLTQVLKKTCAELYGSMKS